MEKSAKHSIFNVLFGLLMLVGSIWAAYDGFHCQPTECNSSPTFLDCASDIMVFLPLAAFFLSRPLWNIRWDANYIYYRAWYGMPVIAPLSSIENIEFNYFSNDGTLEVLNRRKFYIGSRLSNLEELFSTLKIHLGRKYPHKIYQSAFRGIVEVSENCGCLICYSIYPKDRVENWQPYYSENDDDKLTNKNWNTLDDADQGICPVCGSSQGVIADGYKSVISVDEMRILNEKEEGRLDQEELLKRQSLRAKASKYLPRPISSE